MKIEIEVENLFEFPWNLGDVKPLQTNLSPGPMDEKRKWSQKRNKPSMGTDTIPLSSQLSYRFDAERKPI